MSRVLGVDLGEKTIGLAVSDELGLTAQGLPTITRGEPEEDLAALGELIRQFQVQEVVVGLPRHLDGRWGEEAEAASTFARMLETRFHTKTVLWDERWTTKAAERFLIEAGVRRKKRRQVVDRVAAVLILQGYLDSRPPQEEGHVG
ncbi:MAG: Holliday junction resolvase RuvX [candidate division NC10 bacterium]|nr:Holliday junction resolvase RuvX [candidate division NC10 bacterium]